MLSIAARRIRRPTGSVKSRSPFMSAGSAIAAENRRAGRRGEVIQVLRRHPRAADAALHVADARRGQTTAKSFSKPFSMPGGQFGLGGGGRRPQRRVRRGRRGRRLDTA